MEGQGDGRQEPPPSAGSNRLVEPSNDDAVLEEMLGEFSGARVLVPPGSISQLDKFDMTLLDLAQPSPPVLSDSRYYDEKDFQSHRSQDFPQTHQTLRPILTRSVKKKPSVVMQPEEIEVTPQATSSVIPGQSTKSVAGAGGGDAGGRLDYSDLIDSSNSKKVQFEVGGTPFQIEQPESTTSEKLKYKVPVVEDPSGRMIPGDLRDAAAVPLLQASITDGELSEVDKDDLSSHRFANAKGFRRHKHAAKGLIAEEDAPIPPRSKYDHKPHEIFVELDILSGRGENREWKEAARWIKYEEDLEEDAGRWGKPHVASLSFHSLINLRRLLETGVVLLDLEEKDLPGVAYRVVEQMGLSELILMEEKALVLRSLLLKHRHVNESGKVWNLALKRSPGSNTSLQTVFDDRSQRKGLTTVQSVDPGMFRGKQQVRKSFGTGLTHQNSLPSHMYSGVGGGAKDFGIRRRNSQGSNPPHLELNMTKLSGALSEDDLKWIEKESTLMRQIPNDSEATVVLVGDDDSLHGVTIAFVRLAESVYMPNITEVPIPVRFLFILMGPSSADLDYKEIGRSLSTLMSNQHFHLMAYQAEDRRDLLRGINDFLDSCIVLPHGDWDDDLIPFHDLREKHRATQRRKEQELKLLKDARPPPLTKVEKRHGIRNPFRRTRSLFGGIRNDIKCRYALYKSDIIDGLNFQSVATIIFLYFACISGAIAFGDILKIKTDSYIGIPESLLGSSIGGIMFSLLSAQPLLVVGSTGPSLVFDDSLFRFCRGKGMEGSEILAVRSWIGFWLFVIGLLVACFEGSVLVRFFTRFTQEVMSVFISFVFIYESFLCLVKIYREHPMLDQYNSTQVQESELEGKSYASPRPNVALLSTILMLGTFYIANFFRHFKNGAYLTKGMRKTLGNFGVLIAIVAMSCMDFLIRSPETDKLNIPDIRNGLQNSDPSKRGWWIQPLVLPLPWIYAAIIPAFLLYILLFLEASIAGLIVGKRDLKLRKGTGFHLDILVICVINTVMGFWGLPWISSAIVRAVSHVVALTLYSTNNPPGQKPAIIGVKEQRVTTFVVSLLLGCSVLMGPLLRLIPMPVLFGVFLYMGISSMAGIQFLQRFKLFFKQAEKYPEAPYIRKVRTWKMHLFTLVQLVFLGVLWGVKESPLALALPFVIILLIPTRYFVLPRFFSTNELKALDSKGVEDEDEKSKEDGMNSEGNDRKGEMRVTVAADLLDFHPKLAEDETPPQLSFRSI